MSLKRTFHRQLVPWSHIGRSVSLHPLDIEPSMKRGLQGSRTPFPWAIVFSKISQGKKPQLHEIGGKYQQQQKTDHRKSVNSNLFFPSTGNVIHHLCQNSVGSPKCRETEDKLFLRSMLEFPSNMLNSFSSTSRHHFI